MTKMEIILKNKKLKLQMFLIIHSTKRMDAQTHGRPDRGPDFWSEICWSGPWSGFSVRIFSGPVRGPEFGPNCNLVRYVVRILVRKIRTGADFFFGPVRGPEQNFKKLKK